MKTCTLLLALLLRLPALADMAPGFDLRSLSWRSTHIVLAAREPGSVSQFKVLECWKGDLKKGAMLNVRGLDFELLPAKEKPFDPFNNISLRANDLSLPGNVPFDRVMLFLKRDPSGDWTSDEEMKISIAWSRDTMTYAFQQMMNPGPRLLAPTGMTELALRREVKQMCTLQNHFLRIAALPDPKLRADSLFYFVIDERHYDMHKELDEAVTSCGKHGIDLLLRILRTDTAQNIQLHLLQELYFKWREESCAAFTELLKMETAFWNEKAPQLKAGWWDEKSSHPAPEIQYLRHRNGKTYYICAFAMDVKCAEAKKAVEEFRALWFSYPQLYNSHASNQVTQTLNGKN